MDVCPPSCGANNVQFKSGDRIGGAEPVGSLRRRREMTLQGQRICVTGFVSFFRHRPEMILTQPSQVSFVTLPNIAELR